jgi:hypothetical protein
MINAGRPGATCGQNLVHTMSGNVVAKQRMQSVLCVRFNTHTYFTALTFIRGRGLTFENQDMTIIHIRLAYIINGL